mmetsp:Transcript_64847/g.152452  ORF Transcript_64847/g.152452 Transcript_64847/m.152452 type:complete len:306 (+) Transcript_64847:671-1588(+)
MDSFCTIFHHGSRVPNHVIWVDANTLRLQHDQLVGGIRPVSTDWRLFPIDGGLDVEVFDEGEPWSLSLRDVVMDVPIKKPRDVLKQLPLYVRGIWKVPLPSSGEKVGGTHQATVGHVAACSLIQEEELADLFKLAHLAQCDVVLDEFLLPLVHVAREEVGDGLRRPKVIFHQSLELRLKVPVLEHLLHNLAGDLTELVEVETRVPLALPLFFVQVLQLLEHLLVPVVNLTVIENLFMDCIRQMHQGVPGRNAILLIQRFLQSIPPQTMAVFVQVPLIAPFPTSENCLPKGSHHAPTSFRRHLVME